MDFPPVQNNLLSPPRWKQEEVKEINDISREIWLSLWTIASYAVIPRPPINFGRDIVFSSAFLYHSQKSQVLTGILSLVEKFLEKFPQIH